MALLGDLVVRIVGDTADFVRAIDHSGQRLNKFEKDLKKITDTMSKVGKKMTTFVTLPILAIGAAMVKAAADMEMQEAAFTTMLGSAEKAKTLLSDLRDLAAKTPFQLTDLADSTKTMLAFGIETEKVLPYLQQLGDIAMGDAGKLRTLTLAFSQIQSTGRLMGQDLLQLINAGFNPLQIISEKTGETMGELKKRMEAGAISSEEVAEAFKIATSEGGRFFGGMERASKTLTGQFSTLKDDVVTMAISFGNLLLPAIKNIVASISGFVKRLNEMDEGQRKLILTMMGIAAVIGPLLLVGAKLITFLGTLKAAFIAVNIVMAANPILAIVTAVALLGTAAYLLVKNWETVAPFFKKVWNTIIDIFDFAVGPIIALVQEIINVAKEWLIDKFIVIANGVAKIIDGIVVAFGGEAKAHKKIADWIETWEIPARKRLNYSLRDLKVETEGASDALTEDFGPALKGAKGEVDKLGDSIDDLDALQKAWTESWAAQAAALARGREIEAELMAQRMAEIAGEVQARKKAYDERIALEAIVANEIEVIREEKRKAEIKAEEEHQRILQQLRKATWDFTKALISSIASIWDNYYAGLLMNEELTEKERKQIQRDAAVASKRFALFEAVITGAQAIVNAFATKPFLPLGLIMGALATILTGAQIAAIATKPIPALAEGGITPALLHPNEAIIPLNSEEAMSRLIEAVENARTPSVQMGEQLFRVTVNLGSKTLYDDITKATRDRRILIDAGAVA